MTASSEFQGFPPECTAFLSDLTEHNSTSWFKQHRTDYDTFVLEPARRFVESLGEALTGIDSGIVADPRIDKSIYRIHRDVRFSPDKSPYKTHLGIWLWNNAAPRSESCGFYFQIDAHQLMMGAGTYYFTREQLERYRKQVADFRRGAALEHAIARIQATGPYHIAGEHYKRMPRGYNADHPRGTLLRHNTLYAFEETPLPEELHTPEFIDYCMKRCRETAPIHEWLRGIIA